MLAFRLKETTSGAETVLPTTITYRFWQPGKFGITAAPSIPSGLSAGTYELSLGIVDTENRPAVKLAIGGDNGSKWYRMAEIQVK